MRFEPVSYDPASGSLPSPLESAITTSRSPILLLIAADEGGAAVETAVSMAEARSSSGLATVLADATFDDPRLHRAVGLENLEGLADVLLFGASLERVRRRPEGRTFDFVPAGPYVPDPAGVLSSEQWKRVARELEAEDTRLLLLVPGNAPGLGTLSAMAGEAVLIGSGAGLDRAADRLAPSCTVLAAVDPASAAPTPAATGEEVSDERVADERVARDRVAEDRVAEDRVAEDRVADDRDRTEEELSEPAVFRTDRKGRRAVSPVLLLLLVAALLAAAWFVYHQYLSADAAAPVSETPEAPVGVVEEVAPEPEPIPEPVETPLGYSVAVTAHGDLEAARERAADFRSTAPDLGFYVAPVAIRGERWYRVLAGPVTDSASAARLMDRLVSERIKTAAQEWDLRPTDRAFLVGEFPTAAEAEARVGQLSAMEVPAYVVPLRYEPGQTRYRVWVGAYEDDTQSEVMRDVLARAGVEAPLVPRIGVPVGGGS